MNDKPAWPLSPHAMDAASPLREAAAAALRHAAAGESALAEQALDQLFALRGRFHAYPILQDMLAGRRAWHVSGSVYVLGEQPLPPALQKNVDQAVAACAAFLGLPVPVILLQCAPINRDMHLTMESFPGLAMVRLSTLSDGFEAGLREVVFHEITHCFLVSGVRLLDEGLAQLFANRFGGATPVPANAAVLPPLRTLLSRDADSMFGNAGETTIDVYRAACRAGADLLEAIDAMGGAAAIVSLFAAVARAGTDAQIAALVEQASGQTLPPVLTLAEPRAGDATLILQVRQAILAAWSSKQAQDLDAAIAQLESEPVFSTPALLDVLLSAQLNQALLHVHGGAKLSPEREAHIDMLLKAGDCLPPGRLWLWRGTRAILAILLARPNIIKVATAGQNALHAFGKAEQLIPGDSDLLIHHASLLLHAPPNYGGDRDLGASKLRQAMADPLYYAHAREMLLDNGIDPGETPLVAAEPEQPVSTEVAAEPAPPLLEVTGLELAFSSTFTLRPGDFMVRRGERVALVGRNGSGKSMLLETLLGLRQPDRGQVQLHIGDPRQAATRQRLGGLLQGADLPGQMRVSEIMALHQTIYSRTDAAVTRALGLQELRSRLWQQLSRGQQQRVMLWLALSHVPELVLLDEPSLGLDEWYARALRQLLVTLPVTVLLISHVPADLAGMDRILCMDQGRVVDSGRLDDLVDRRVGRFKARIGQALPEQGVQAMQALAGLVQPPQPSGDGWELYGNAAFDGAFRQFIAQQRIGVFSLEAATVEDFLAQLAHE